MARTCKPEAIPLGMQPVAIPLGMQPVALYMIMLHW